MGYGDSLIVTSIVRKAKEKFPDRPLVVGDGHRIHWCPVFDHNPRISRNITPDCVWIREVKGNRPYINYVESTPQRTAWNYGFHVKPGELFLTKQELDWQDRGFVYIEPNVKGSFGGNKDWGFDNWQEVVNALPDVRFIQGAGRRLAGVEQRQTDSFRHACGLLSHADFFVGTDGGLHHAAAALGKRAVVVWGGLVPPSILGYDSHVNLCRASRWCGSIAPCLHCRQAMQKITVDMVIDAIRRLVEAGGQKTPESAH